MRSKKAAISFTIGGTFLVLLLMLVFYPITVPGLYAQWNGGFVCGLLVSVCAAACWMVIYKDD